MLPDPGSRHADPAVCDAMQSGRENQSAQSGDRPGTDGDGNTSDPGVSAGAVNEMTTKTIMTTCRDIPVNMGQYVVAAAPARLVAVLGSCVGVALFDRRLRLGGLAHVVLPDGGHGTDNVPGKYAATAVEALVEAIEQRGARAGGLVAKIAGGASILGRADEPQLGEANVAAVLEALEAARIEVVGRHIGGTKGRRVVLDCASGDYHVNTVGMPPAVL